MKFHLFFTFALLLFSSITHFGCVGKKRFTTEIGQRDSANQVLNSRVLSLNQEIGGLQLQLAEKTGEVKVLKDLNTRQEGQIKYLDEQIEKLTSQTLTQQQLMDVALKQKQGEVAEKEQQIQNLQAAIERQKQTMQELLNNIQAALQKYDTGDLTFEVKDGKAYVGLSEKLLFKSGSAALGRQAMDVLGKIAEVLVAHPEMNIIVEGHTDNVPIRSKEFKDNWDLSVIRATTVVRILTNDFNLTASQITPAGKGEYEPKASNETSEGRAMNRRTEIIIAPHLSEVLRLIQVTGQ